MKWWISGSVDPQSSVDAWISRTTDANCKLLIHFVWGVLLSIDQSYLFICLNVMWYYHTLFHPIANIHVAVQYHMTTISHDYSITWLHFDQSDSFTLVRFNQWPSSIVMWFGLSWYSLYTVRSVHFRMLLISHKYIFSFSKLIKHNVSGHDTLIGDESGINSNIWDLI